MNAGAHLKRVCDNILGIGISSDGRSIVEKIARVRPQGLGLRPSPRTLLVHHRSVGSLLVLQRRDDVAGVIRVSITPCRVML